MSTKNLKCADIIKLEFQDRKETISDLFELKNDFAHCEDSAQAFHEFGLSIDYIEPNTFEDQEHGYIRYQLSWGGPSDELRFYLDDNKQLYKSEYCYKDWFDGAVIDVSDEPIINDLWHDFIQWTLPLKKGN